MDKKKYSADFFISVVTLIAQQNSFVYCFYNTVKMAELVDLSTTGRRTRLKICS